MKLATLLKYQFIFFMMAIIYLILSYINILNDEPSLSPANPLASGALLCLYASFLLTSHYEKLYRILMFASVVGFGYGGVIYNLVSFYQHGTDGFSSSTSFFIAVTINLYGTFFNVIATSGRYKR